MFNHVDTSGKAPAKYSAEDFLELLRALSDENRQNIIKLFFSEKEVCVNDIASHFTLSRPTISHHLNLMKRARLLKSRKEGKEVYYSVNREYVIDIFEAFLKSFKNCC